MSRLEVLIKELCPEGVEYKLLGDISKRTFVKGDFKNTKSSVLKA